MELTLPDYYILENGSYVKDILVTSDKEDLRLSNLILITRYKEPTEDMVVNKICTTSNEILSNSRFKPLDDVDKMLTRLNGEVLAALAKREKDFVEFIKSSTRAVGVEESERKTYLRVNSDILPSGIMAKNMDQRGDALENLISSYSENRYSGNVFSYRYLLNLILSNGGLPKKSDVDILLNYGSLVSDAFIVDYTAPNNNLLRKLDRIPLKFVIDNMYKCIKTPEDINLRDITDTMLYLATKEAVYTLSKGISIRSTSRNSSISLTSGSSPSAPLFRQSRTKRVIN